jgi:ribosome-associated toxin RatA of RatAB toxin-antitoxin module
LLLVFAFQLSGQENDWKLKKQTKDLTIFYRQPPASKLKELKMTAIFESNLSTIVAVLKDVEAYPEWLYGCRRAEVVHTLAPFRFMYVEMDFPWPLSDRDYYGQAHLVQDPHTKVVTSRMVGIPEFGPEEENFVRIPQMEVIWKFTPIDEKTTHLDYLLRSDPGGSLPAWLINLALDKGPSRSLRQFGAMLKLEKYKKQSFAYIQN